MQRLFTKTFFRFLTAFLVIIAIACATLVITASGKGEGRTVDDTASLR